MTFEKGDHVAYTDKHSEHDGEVGEVTQVVETMFGDANYTVKFEEGQETGVPESALEIADDEAQADDAENETDDE